MRASLRAAFLRWRVLIVVLATLVIALAPATLDGAIAAERESADARATAEPGTDALPLAEWTAIRNVIDEQLAALRRGDAERAFAFASDGIRERFGDAPTFLRMVRDGYAALLAARHVEYLQGAVIAGATIQPLRLVMGDDTVLVALYQMQKDDAGRWRIAGCVIAPSTVRST
jgi:hypothetical protein